MSLEKQKVTEVIASGIDLESKIAVRMGTSLAGDFNRMLKLLDSLYLKNIIDRNVYLRIYVMSIPAILQRSKVYQAENLKDYLVGTMTTIQAIASDPISIQLTESDERDMLDYMNKREYNLFQAYLEKHLDSMDKIKPLLSLEKTSSSKSVISKHKELMNIEYL